MQTGCYIDGSHKSSTQFTIDVIDYAIDHGFEIDYDVYIEDTRKLFNDELEGENLYEVLDALDDTYYSALDYLNDNTREGMYWMVEEQALFLLED